ncbi:DUF3316 domain-containing protein, partial [Leucothrix sargassi]
LSALIATSVLLISATAANANSFFEETSSKTITTGFADSRDAAYQSGIDKLSALKSVSPYQLSEEVGLFESDIQEDTVKVSEQSFVSVQERMNADGKLGYVGVVNIGINYETYEGDN